ncbi:hypothetical protein D3C71_1582980 [compost metagenome]
MEVQSVVGDHVTGFYFLPEFEIRLQVVGEGLTCHRTESTTQFYRLSATVFILHSNSVFTDRSDLSIIFRRVSKQVVHTVSDYFVVASLNWLDLITFREHCRVILNADKVNPLRVISVSTR